MKKILSIILVLVICLSLCACSTSSNSQKEMQGQQMTTYEKVTYRNGNTDVLELGSLHDKYDENAYAYKKDFAGSKIEVVTTFNSITEVYGTDNIPAFFSGGWHIYLKKKNPILTDLKGGTTVIITGTLNEYCFIEDATIEIVD